MMRSAHSSNCGCLSEEGAVHKSGGAAQPGTLREPTRSASLRARLKRAVMQQRDDQLSVRDTAPAIASSTLVCGRSCWRVHDDRVCRRRATARLRCVASIDKRAQSWTRRMDPNAQLCCLRRHRREHGSCLASDSCRRARRYGVSCTDRTRGREPRSLRTRSAGPGTRLQPRRSCSISTHDKRTDSPQRRGDRGSELRREPACHRATFCG